MRGPSGLAPLAAPPARLAVPRALVLVLVRLVLVKSPTRLVRAEQNWPQLRRVNANVINSLVMAGDEVNYVFKETIQMSLERQLKADIATLIIALLLRSMIIRNVQTQEPYISVESNTAARGTSY